jgi:aldehyde:ferredoxin oxidoreductase
MVLDRNIGFINLTDRSIENKPIPLDLRKNFLGGRGINIYLLSKSYSSQLDPFSPENPLISGAGRLTGEEGIRDNVGNRSV